MYSVYLPEHHMTIGYDNTCGGIMVTMANGDKYAHLPPYHKSDGPSLTETLHNYFMWQAATNHPEYFATPNAAFITERWGKYESFEFGIDTIDTTDERFCALQASPLFDHIVTVRFTFEYKKKGEARSHFAGETLKLFRVSN